MGRDKHNFTPKYTRHLHCSYYFWRKSNIGRVQNIFHSVRFFISSSKAHDIASENCKNSSITHDSWVHLFHPSSPLPHHTTILIQYIAPNDTGTEFSRRNGHLRCLVETSVRRISLIENKYRIIQNKPNRHFFQTSRYIEPKIDTKWPDLVHFFYQPMQIFWGIFKSSG